MSLLSVTGRAKRPRWCCNWPSSKQGIIRGNSTNTTTNETQVIHGAVDKKTERAAWTIGDNQQMLMETGIYNLTKDQTPVLVHVSKDQTKQWLLVRLNQKKDADDKS